MTLTYPIGIFYHKFNKIQPVFYFMEGKICPKCGSDNSQAVDYLGTKCIICRNCGFDEATQYKVYPEQKTNQREKAK